MNFLFLLSTRFQQRSAVFRVCATCCLLVGPCAPLRAEDTKPALTAPFRHVRAKAYHIPPETTTEESDHFIVVSARELDRPVVCLGD